VIYRHKYDSFKPTLASYIQTIKNVQSFSNGVTACEMLLLIDYCCFFPILLCFGLHFLLFYALQ